MTEERADSNYLINTFTGLQGYLSSSTDQSVSLESLYASNGLVQKIIDTYPLDAYNLGFKLIGASAERETEFLNQLGCYEVFKLASISARITGIAAVLIGYADNLPLEMPSRPNSPIRWLKAYQIDDNEPDDNGTILLGESRCHISRLLLFYGRRTFKKGTKGNLIETGEPVLKGVEELLTMYIKNIPYLPALIRLSNQVSLGTKGLAAAIKKDVITKTDVARQEILLRLQSLNLGRDVSNILAYDLEGEEVTVTSLSLNGITELMTETELALSFHLNYPRSKLFDRGSSVGLTTSTNAQIINRLQWATSLTSWIDNNWTKPLESLIKALGFTSTIEIPLAIQLTEIEQAELDKLNIENLQKLRDSGVIDDQEFRNIVTQLTQYALVDRVLENTPSVSSPERVDSVTLSEILNGFTNIGVEDIDTVMLEIGNQSQTL